MARADEDTTISYGYDDRGTRVGRASSDAADPPLRYLTDAYNPTGYSQVLSEIDGASAEARRDFMYGESMLAQAEAALGGGEPGEAEWFVGDHLGSIRGLTGAGGSAIVDSAYDYSPYGLPLGASAPGAASSLTSYAYTGQWREALTGLQYHRARWLDPGAGRWLSVDPVFDFPGNYGHPYAYVGMSPIGKRDVSGLFSLGELNVTGSIQAICTQIVIPNVVEHLMRATMSAFGIDPMVLIEPIFSAIVEAVGLAELMDELHEKIQNGIEMLSDSELIDALSDLVRMLTILSIAIEACITVKFLALLFINRTIMNAYEALTQIWAFVRSLHSFFAEYEVSFNPKKKGKLQWHHIATNKGKVHDYPRLFKKLFDSAGLSRNSKYNVIAVPGHAGNHPPEYHDYVYSKFRKKLRGVRGRSNRRKELIIALEELAEEILADPTMLKWDHPRWGR